MRTVADIPHPEFKITVFQYNNKYLLKLERSMLEQTYKVDETDLDAEFADLLTEEFLENARTCFSLMREAWKKSLGEV